MVTTLAPSNLDNSKNIQSYVNNAYPILYEFGYTKKDLTNILQTCMGSEAEIQEKLNELVLEGIEGKVWQQVNNANKKKKSANIGDAKLKENNLTGKKPSKKRTDKLIDKRDSPDILKNKVDHDYKATKKVDTTNTTNNLTINKITKDEENKDKNKKLENNDTSINDYKTNQANEKKKSSKVVLSNNDDIDLNKNNESIKKMQTHTQINRSSWASRIRKSLKSVNKVPDGQTTTTIDIKNSDVSTEKVSEKLLEAKTDKGNLPSNVEVQSTEQNKDINHEILNGATQTDSNNTDKKIVNKNTESTKKHTNVNCEMNKSEVNAQVQKSSSTNNNDNHDVNNPSAHIALPVNMQVYEQNRVSTKKMSQPCMVANDLIGPRYDTPAFARRPEYLPDMNYAQQRPINQLYMGQYDYMAGPEHIYGVRDSRGNIIYDQLYNQFPFEYVNYDPKSIHMMPTIRVDKGVQKSIDYDVDISTDLRKNQQALHKSAVPTSNLPKTRMHDNMVEYKIKMNPYLPYTEQYSQHNPIPNMTHSLKDKTKSDQYMHSYKTFGTVDNMKKKYDYYNNIYSSVYEPPMHDIYNHTVERQMPHQMYAPPHAELYKSQQELHNHMSQTYANNLQMNRRPPNTRRDNKGQIKYYQNNN